jgi:hypothetical protein
MTHDKRKIPGFKGREAFRKLMADPEYAALFKAKVKASQKRRFATEEGKAHQRKMIAGRWKGYVPLTPEQKKLVSAGLRKLTAMKNPEE